MFQSEFKERENVLVRGSQEGRILSYLEVETGFFFFCSIQDFN